MWFQQARAKRGEGERGCGLPGGPTKAIPNWQGCRWYSQLLLTAGTMFWIGLKYPQPPALSTYMTLFLANPFFRSKDLFCFHGWEGPQKLDSDQSVLWSRHETIMGTAPLGQEAFTPGPLQPGRLGQCWYPYTTVWGRYVSCFQQTPKQAHRLLKTLINPNLEETCWSHTLTLSMVTLWAQGSPPYCGSTQSYPVDPTSANTAVIYFSSEKCKLG